MKRQLMWMDGGKEDLCAKICSYQTGSNLFADNSEQGFVCSYLSLCEIQVYRKDSVASLELKHV